MLSGTYISLEFGPMKVFLFGFFYLLCNVC